jgi:hypothetical protein
VGNCRTCSYWTGDIAGKGLHAPTESTVCDNAQSPLHGEMTTTCGYCQKWDSWDQETALEVLGTDGYLTECCFEDDPCERHRLPTKGNGNEERRHSGIDHVVRELWRFFFARNAQADPKTR